jgi:hypothetical protein
MTVIAYDGEKLVADRAGTNGGYRRTVTKIFRVPGGMVGFCGNAIHAQQMLAWFMEGRKPDNYPHPCEDDEHASAMFVDLQGRIWHFERGPLGLLVHEKFDAVGSGRDYALSAMFLGWDAEMAVSVASHFDNCCGNGCDVIALEDVRKEQGAS